MKNLKLLLIAFLIPTILFTACKDETNDDNNTSQSSHEILAAYLVENDMDLPDVVDAWIQGAPALADVATFIDSYNIIDIRSSADYDAGHIEGAVNSALTDVITTAGEFTETKPVLVVCYTGQTAGHAVVALRLSGYPDAKVLKWGMAGWRTGDDYSGKWESKTAQLNHSNWVSTGTAATTVPFTAPDLSISGSDAEALLNAQVASMLAGGLSGEMPSTILDAPQDYFINNFWSETDFNTYGHIDGCYRINSLSLEEETIYNLDSEKPVVTYCWTGQTSSMITAYLTVIGYDAVSLKFGANGIIHDDLTAAGVHFYSEPTEDLPVVPTK